MKQKIKNLNTMKHKSHFLKIYIFLIYTFILFNLKNINAQNDTSKIDPMVNLSYLKMSNGDIKLSCDLKYRKEKKFTSINSAEVFFFIGKDFAKAIGSLKTDESGNATLIISHNYKIEKETDGTMNFGVKFKGDSKFNPKETTVSAKELQIHMHLGVIDSVNTVTISADEINANGKSVSVNELTIGVYIKRMFSLYKIGQGTLKETEKEFKVECPKNLPGDSIGNFVIVARIDDHEMYGTVEKTEKVNWGIPKLHRNFNPRALWTQVAPTWMIITLIILLVGVWGHYVWSLLVLLKIHKQGVKTKNTDMIS